MQNKINSHDTQTRLSEILRRVERGETFTITNHAKRDRLAVDQCAERFWLNVNTRINAHVGPEYAKSDTPLNIPI